MKAGWEALSSGASADARRHFAWQAVLDPNCAEARVGFALAISSMGELAGGANSIRRALEVDPQVLGGLHLDARLVPLANDLVERYRLRLESRDKKVVAGATLYLASLDALLRAQQPAHADAEPPYSDEGSVALAVDSPRVEDEIPSTPPAAQSLAADEEGRAPPAPPRPDQMPAAPEPAPLPRVDVDYDQLRADLGRTSAVLDRFTEKLLARIHTAR
jgi:hypothetical protein